MGKDRAILPIRDQFALGDHSSLHHHPQGDFIQTVFPGSNCKPLSENPKLSTASVNITQPTAAGPVAGHRQADGIHEGRGGNSRDL